jgi:hypothetical protein
VGRSEAQVVAEMDCDVEGHCFEPTFAPEDPLPVALACGRCDLSLAVAR